MALSGLIPKGWFEQRTDPTPTPSSSSAPAPVPPAPESSPLSTPENDFFYDDGLLPGRTTDGKFKLPPVAIYVSGAAFAVTVGLTVLIIPLVRANRRKTGEAPDFLSIAHLQIRPQRGMRSINPPRPLPSSSIASDLARRAVGNPSVSRPAPLVAAIETVKGRWARTVDDDIAPPELRAWRRFNTLEERRLYGVSDADPVSKEEDDDEDDPYGLWNDENGQQEPEEETLPDGSWKITRLLADSPGMMFWAFGLATAAVGLSGAIGFWAATKALGIDISKAPRGLFDEEDSTRQEGLEQPGEDWKTVANKILLAKDEDQ